MRIKILIGQKLGYDRLSSTLFSLNLDSDSKGRIWERIQIEIWIRIQLVMEIRNLIFGKWWILISMNWEMRFREKIKYWNFGGKREGFWGWWWLEWCDWTWRWFCGRENWDMEMSREERWWWMKKVGDRSHFCVSILDFF